MMNLDAEKYQKIAMVNGVNVILKCKRKWIKTKEESDGGK